MRRFLVVVVGLALIVPFGMTGASAEPSERYESKSYNAYWHSRKRIDSDTYLRTTWYAGVYVSEESSGEGEVEFWSDLYKSSVRCERRPGRDRCRNTHAGLYGVINDLGNGTFTLDPDLQSGYFEAAYPMTRSNGREADRIGKIRITVDLVAIGDVEKFRQSYSYESGCFRGRYSGRSQSVQAEASGTLTFLRADRTITLKSTKSAWMSQGESLSIERTCEE